MTLADVLADKIGTDLISPAYAAANDPGDD
jgi:hypothetical protein